MTKQFLFIFIIFFCCHNSYAATTALSLPSEASSAVNGKDVNSVMDYVTAIASQVSCEVGGVASILVRGEMSHTCVSPISFMDAALYTLIAPTWPLAMMKLKMNYDNLDYLMIDGKSQCHVSNRANYDNPYVNFSFCNIRLREARVFYDC